MKTGQLLSSIVTAVIVMTSLTLTSCSPNFSEVKLEVNQLKTIDFNKYDKIVYADLILESTPEDFNPGKELNDFFVGDLSKVLGKNIEPLNMADIDKDIKGDTEDTARLENIKARLGESPNSLVITGKLTFDIKTRTKVDDVKGESGKKEKTFVKVQHWGLTMKVRIIEVDTGKELFNKSYSEKIAGADVHNPKYNFDDLFFKLNNNFTRDLTSKKSTQRRYLLTE
ncbi:MAG: hypothetical protein NT166_16525 [Candidatus Aminicenantes bacterium]|nr:hypothetical protein [Candidatus Aminicenantes bacterium]